MSEQNSSAPTTTRRRSRSRSCNAAPTPSSDPMDLTDSKPAAAEKRPAKRARKGGKGKDKGKAKAEVPPKEPTIVVLSSSDDEATDKSSSAPRQAAKKSELENLDELAVVEYPPFGPAWVVEKVAQEPDDKGPTFYKLQLPWAVAYVKRDCIKDLAQNVIFHYSTGKGAISITQADKYRLSPNMYLNDNLITTLNGSVIAACVPLVQR